MRTIQGFVWAGVALLHVFGSSDAFANGRKPVPYQVQKPPLDTDWTYKVGINPWPEHPRPQLRRENWTNLNGIWTYDKAGQDDHLYAPSPPEVLSREVMIPSCVESALSGIQDLDATAMWFARNFSVPDSWQQHNVLLHFEAVDYEATVFLNGVEVGYNVGGYFRFTIDITKNVKWGQENRLSVYVLDPTDLDVIPRGKQTRNPSHIFYRSCSGIWQTVWLESAPSNHITQLDVSAGRAGDVTMAVHSSAKQGTQVKVAVVDTKGEVVAEATGPSDKEFKFVVSSPRLWSPSTPTLYNLTVTMGNDRVQSYTGFRTISSGVVEGVQRPLLNGEFVFLFGTLDQGYWPDGLYTPPNREAMIYDLKMLKSLGFNMIRKHVKVEPDLFYRACDEIGLLVIQDMPSLFAAGDKSPSILQQAEFERQLQILIQEHKSYPCIGIWTIFNEGWGQSREAPYSEGRLSRLVRQLDPSRLIDAVSGWNDHGFGDFSDNHHYANPQCGTPFYSLASSRYDPARIGFQGEFGGIGHVPEMKHLWDVQLAIDQINQTYEINADLESYNYRASVLFRELTEQVERYACSGGVWTQTTDVEGEVNGLYTYDRRLLRPDVGQWKSNITGLYKAAQLRGGSKKATIRGT
ncbi:hypothetical protein E4U42_003397 [Claviceps africana]|uniref:Beta-galactosidase n=1 Tax=Claviceps africana TaxID=83212 RepID=A0A8K0NGV7_9HYPO|nr:hypothetical protein E4U42_003397 [Claviceps africana]